jgi:hypothetical protein
MIITICGSQTFCKRIEEAKKYLNKKGHQVFAPELLVTEEWFQENHSREEFLRMKPIWTNNHFKKIQESDAVLIWNEEKKGIHGYFGSNTLMELSVAFFLGKKIFLLHPINEDHPHFEELIGMKTIVLNGDLDSLG